jgi:hypothetical protein
MAKCGSFCKTCRPSAGGFTFRYIGAAVRGALFFEEKSEKSWRIAVSGPGAQFARPAFPRSRDFTIDRPVPGVIDSYKRFFWRTV